MEINFSNDPSIFIDKYFPLYTETDNYLSRSKAIILKRAKEHYGVRKWSDEKYSRYYLSDVISMFRYGTSTEHVETFRRLFEDFCKVYDVDISYLHEYGTPSEYYNISTSINSAELHSIRRTETFIKEFLT